MRILFLLWFAMVPALAAGADVVVYGGTSAGVAAAVQVARMGRSVVLVAPEKHVGGLAVEGLGGGDVNNHWFQNDVAIGGLSREFYLRLGRKYGASGPVYRYESHVAEEVFEDLLRESKVSVSRGRRLREPLRTSVEWAPGAKALRAIITESGERFEGKVFIDATLEGDLLAAAGVETTSGREANSKYGETKNGIRANTTHAQFQVRVDPYKTPGDPRSGLIPTIQDEPLGVPGAGDTNIQAFCFRLCLTRDPANRIPFQKPEGFDRSQYEIYFRYVRAGGKLWTPSANLPNGKTDLGSWHDLSANLYGMNREWPNGDYKTRERIYQQHRQFTQGLLWLLANDPEIPAALRAEWSQWGLTRDEFTDNGGWPRQLYVRDARRMVSDYVITEHHTRRINPTPVADPIAVAFWPTDTHSVRRIVRDGAAYNEGFVFDDNNWGPFGISYRSLVPRRAEATNLITPTCPSSSHVAYGAIRLEQTFLSLGQAAATAAVLAVSRGAAVQDVPYTELSQRLLSEGQILSLALVPAMPGKKQ
jgi:FAD dependent oxidoreductase